MRSPASVPPRCTNAAAFAQPCELTIMVKPPKNIPKLNAMNCVFVLGVREREWRGRARGRRSGRAQWVADGAPPGKSCIRSQQLIAHPAHLRGGLSDASLAGHEEAGGQREGHEAQRGCRPVGWVGWGGWVGGREAPRRNKQHGRAQKHAQAVLASEAPRHPCPLQKQHPLHPDCPPRRRFPRSATCHVSASRQTGA